MSKQSTSPAKQTDARLLITGSISGAVSRTVTNPLERLKMLRQVAVGEYASLSMAQSYKYMWQKEGLHGFFKGNGVNVLRIAPFSAFEFFFYDFYKNQLFAGDNSSNLKKLVCGGLTGMTASTLTYPLDLIRTKLSIEVADASVKPTIWGTGVQIYREGGFLGLYKGLPSTLFGIAPYIGFKMASFDILKSLLQVDKSSPYGQLGNLVLGGTAGTISLTLTYPTDLVRRMMQIQGTGSHEAYANMFDCFAKIYAKEGIAGLYKGYMASFLKVAPSMAILFWCNELLKSFIGVN